MRSTAILLTFATASLGLTIVKERRQDDLASILAALEQTSPDDAAAAKSAGSSKRQDDLASILAALEQTSPDDAAAAKAASGSTKRDELGDILVSNILFFAGTEY